MSASRRPSTFVDRTSLRPSLQEGSSLCVIAALNSSQLHQTCLFAVSNPGALLHRGESAPSAPFPGHWWVQWWESVCSPLDLTPCTQDCEPHYGSRRTAAHLMTPSRLASHSASSSSASLWLTPCPLSASMISSAEMSPLLSRSKCAKARCRCSFWVSLS